MTMKRNLVIAALHSSFELEVQLDELERHLTILVAPSSKARFSFTIARQHALDGLVRTRQNILALSDELDARVQLRTSHHFADKCSTREMLPPGGIYLACQNVQKYGDFLGGPVDDPTCGAVILSLDGFSRLSIAYAATSEIESVIVWYLNVRLKWQLLTEMSDIHQQTSMSSKKCQKLQRNKQMQTKMRMYDWSSIKEWKRKHGDHRKRVDMTELMSSGYNYDRPKTSNGGTTYIAAATATSFATAIMKA
ncbi:hypothetical protein EDC04DRAFT_2602783 [Pisolithus marmoratus]|nr:hypothetical protein EDC04DRAFT_2602783 [Pisolithus marmoratus]